MSSNTGIRSQTLIFDILFLKTRLSRLDPTLKQSSDFHDAFGYFPGSCLFDKVAYTFKYLYVSFKLRQIVYPLLYDLVLTERIPSPQHRSDPDILSMRAPSTPDIVLDEPVER